VFNHIKNKITNATISTEPFPNCFIEEILPPDIYSNLLDNIPPEELFDRVRPKKEFQLQGENNLNKLKPSARDFWMEAINCLCSEEFQDLIVNKFGCQRGWPQLILYCDYQNFQLGPHIDRKDKLFTSLFYLPKDASQMHLGTVLLKSKDIPLKRKRVVTASLKWEPFNIVFRSEFKPNSFFCFSGSESYHGVELISEDVERFTMQYLIRDFKISGHYYPQSI